MHAQVDSVMVALLEERQPAGTFSARKRFRIGLILLMFGAQR